MRLTEAILRGMMREKVQLERGHERARNKTAIRFHEATTLRVCEAKRVK